jgi:hypothetical protein
VQKRDVVLVQAIGEDQCGKDSKSFAGTIRSVLRMLLKPLNGTAPSGDRPACLTTETAFHTSNEHPWFRAARWDRQSRYRRYYEWSDAPPPAEADAINIFPGEEQRLDL